VSNTKVCPKCGLEDREDIVNACVKNDNKRCGNLITKKYTDNMQDEYKIEDENERTSAELTEEIRSDQG